jgi:uncharacterized SAM-binding protein YcdF (DUF218 family)
VTDIINWAKEALRLGNIAFILAVLSVGLALLFIRPRWGRRWIVAVVLTYWFVSTPLGSTLLVRPLAGNLHSLEDAQEAGSAGAIVVLGGGIRELKVGPDLLASPFDSTTLRVIEAARVFRLLDGRPIVVASGGMSGRYHLTTEGEVIADALTKLGVPRDRIIVEDMSLTTHDQAILVTRLLKSRGVDRFVLVTSPMHMSRSVAVFRAQHAEVVPSLAPLVAERSRSQRSFMPNTESLGVSDEAVYDYAGFVYYWAHGWFLPTPVSGNQ